MSGNGQPPLRLVQGGTITPAQRQLLKELRHALDLGALVRHEWAQTPDEQVRARQPCLPWPLDAKGEPVVFDDVGMTYEEVRSGLVNALRMPGYRGWLMPTCSTKACMNPCHFRDP
jgi:hypothetical protein